jgi:iron complex outermembrane recepter protein
MVTLGFAKNRAVRRAVRATPVAFRCGGFYRYLWGTALALATPPAFAQQTPVAAAEPDTALSEIVVTGSRIARPELERLQPTTVIGSDLIDKRQYTNVVDALNELPAFGQADNSLVGAQSGFGIEQSFANFFSLGRSAP